MSQQASVGGPRGPRVRSLRPPSMEYAPRHRKGKGREAPSFTARFLRLNEQADLTCQPKLLIFRVLRDEGMIGHHSSVVMELLEASNVSNSRIERMTTKSKNERSQSVATGESPHVGHHKSKLKYVEGSNFDAWNSTSQIRRLVQDRTAIIRMRKRTHKLQSAGLSFCRQCRRGWGTNQTGKSTPCSWICTGRNAAERERGAGNCAALKRCQTVGVECMGDLRQEHQRATGMRSSTVAIRQRQMRDVGRFRP
jgi:hypothetical protein